MRRGRAPFVEAVHDAGAQHRGRRARHGRQQRRRRVVIAVLIIRIQLVARLAAVGLGVGREERVARARPARDPHRRQRAVVQHRVHERAALRSSANTRA